MHRSVIVLLAAIACGDADDGRSVTLDSIAALDGSVDRAGGVDGTSAEMEIGRNGSGIGTRGFVSFDVADLLPAEGEEAVVTGAALSVYENNFNLAPWAEMGNALIEIVAYDTLDAAAFDTMAIGEPAVASTDSDFLDFHQIGMDAFVTTILNEDPAAGLAQFRIRFTDDRDTDDQTLQDHHWDLNTAEATDPPDSTPTLSFDVEYVEVE